MNILDRIQNMLDRATDAIVYDADNLINLRLFAVRTLNDLRDLKGGTPEPARRLDTRRFALTLSACERFDFGTGASVKDGERTLYFIGSLVTQSKILAIKEVRSIDGIGLKEAKDLVDGLQEQSYRLKTVGDVAYI